MIRCQSCGKELPDGSKFCDACGSLINEAPATNNYADNNAYTGDVTGGNAAAKSGNMKKYLMLGGIALAAVVLLIVIIAVIASSGEDKSNHALYFKDGELMFTKLNKIDPAEMSDDIISEDIQLTDDGKIIAYKEDLDDNTLFWRYTNKPDKEPVKVKDDVAEYALTEDGKYIVFVTSNGKLYEYNLSKQEDIQVNKEAEISAFGDVGYVYYETDTEEQTEIDEDGNELTEEVEVRTYFLKKFGKDEPIQLAEEVDGSFRCADVDEMKEFYYVDNESLYKIAKPGKEAEKIESDVYSIARVTKSGNLYFTKEEESEISVSADSDPMTIDTKTLYFYNGKESTKVVDYYNSWDDYAVDGETFIIDVLKPDNISEDKDLYDTAEAALVVNGVLCDLGKEDAQGFTVSDDGSTVYYFADITYKSEDGEETGEFDSATLYRVKVGKNSIKSNEKVADGVYGRYTVLDVESGKKVVYFKDWDDEEGCGTLFVNDKQVDTDVERIVAVHEYSDAFLYRKDYKDGAYTLWICDNGKSGEKVDDDVYKAAFTDEGDVLYLDDYDSEDGEGTLKVFDGKSEEIDTEVNGFIADVSANGGSSVNIIE